jgi:hypothetical protein
MDLPSRERRYDCSRAGDVMLEATDTDYAPRYLLRSDGQTVRPPQPHFAFSQSNPPTKLHDTTR